MRDPGESARYETMDTKELALLAEQDDNGALAELCRRFVLRLLTRFYVPGMTPDDVAQEAFLQVLKNREQYDRERGTFQVWVFRLIHNLIIDLIRKANRRIEPDPELPEGPESPDAQNGESASIERELSEALSECMERLPPDEREIIMRRYYGNRGFEDFPKDFLFTVDVRFAIELDSETISDGLRDVFERSRYPLADASVTVGRPGAWWRVVDKRMVEKKQKRRIYVIERDSDALRVYVAFNPGTIKKRLSRALERLKDCLESKGFGGLP